MRLATNSLRWIVVVLLTVFAGLAMQAVAKTKIKKPIATGKDFYIVFPKAAWGNQSVGILINSPSKQKITVTTPSGQKGTINITKAQTTQYYAGQFRIEKEAGVVKKQEATRIQSPNPISVHGQFGVAGISGTYTAIPVSAWGTEYYAIAPPEGTNQDYWYYPTIYSTPMITIISAHQGNTVTITPACNTSAGNPAGIPFNVTLNQGDVYNVTSPGDPQAINRVEDPCEADLTGSHLQSTFPIGVICAQSHSTWPCGYNECGDYCVEYIPPVCNWDSMYVITPSVPRLGGLAGEQLRIVFGYNGTDLIVDDGLSSPRTVGTYAAGDWIDYPSPIGAALILKGSKPFLPVELTTKPAACQAGSSGGENWTLGMVVMSGVNQWGDYTPYSTAVGSQSVANICFRQSDEKHLKLNGKPLIEQFPVVNLLPEGFATVPISVNQGSYNELTGDSGATAGGSIFGFGTLRFSPNSGNSGEHVQDPEVIKSFCHPIGVNALPACNPDITPPHITDTMTCGHWDITGFDDEINPPATGLYDIWLAYSDPPDTSFNVKFNPAPVFGYGDSRSNLFGIDVINLAQPAQAALHLRDGAGNEYDTLLTYSPQVIDATPSFLDLGANRSGTSATGIITLHNRSNTVADFSTFRLRYGAAHHWKFIPPSPTPPFSIPPGDSIKFYFEYDAPNVQQIEFDNDTLFVTTCKEFPIAALLAEPKKPAIFTQCYDFGNGTIDTPPFTAGDTLSSGKNVYVTSIGSDTLHITNISINGTMTGEPGFPASDFQFSGKFFKVDTKNNVTTLAFPTIAAPWQLAPQETAFVEVMGHPHHPGARGQGLPSTSPTNNAYVYFENDAFHILMDSACLSIYGLSPGIFAKGIDYGTHLYATTKDSFFVVRNTGEVPVTILKDGFDHGPSPDSNNFVFHQYVDPVTQSFIQYNLADTLMLNAADPSRGLPADTVRVPYRFIAQRLGLNTDTMVVANTSPQTPTIYLTGKVIEPRIVATGDCSPDSVFLGGSATQTISVGNVGTDTLIIDQIDFGTTPHATDWTITSIQDKVSGAALQLPFALAPLTGMANVNLKFVPDVTGPVSANVHFVGHDLLLRHSADSASSTSYPWGVLPYDTSVQVCYAGFASGIAATDLHLEQYVTKDTSGVIWIKNTGAGIITVSNVDVVGQDADSAFISAVFQNAFPFDIAAGDSSPVTIKFAPNPWSNQPVTSGRRNYMADFVITNSTGTPITAHFTGRGHGVDIHSMIARTYFAEPGQTIETPVKCDYYADTLGMTDIRGYIMEMVHYHRKAIKANVPLCIAPANQQQTVIVAPPNPPGTVQENYSEDTLHDASHLIGEQGYLELNVTHIPVSFGDPTGKNLVNLYFTALTGLDTSELNFEIKHAAMGDAAGTVMDYVNSTTSPGFVTVDSVCGLNVSKIRFSGATLSLQQNSPNPFPATTNISFSQPYDGHVKLSVVNTVGEVVATVIDQDLPNGTFNAKFDGSALPNGLYSYRLETNGGNLQKQMMLMR